MRAGRVQRRLAALAGLFAIALIVPAQAVASEPAANQGRTADLDGKPIPLTDVGKWYCQDFAHPAIHCYNSASALETAVAAPLAAAATTSLTYVVVYDYTLYQGGYMYMSDNYTALSLIGWNDRISSFSVRNNMSGKFWTDWLYSGTGYYFCCNSQVNSLGSYDDTFSSVFHY